MKESERLRKENDELQKQVETFLENVIEEINQQLKEMRGN